MRRDKFRHLEHRDLALAAENHLQFFVRQNIPLVGRILEIVSLDVLPQFLDDLPPCHRALAGDRFKLGRKVHRLHEGRIRCSNHRSNNVITVILSSTAQVYPPRNPLHSRRGYSFLEPVPRLAVDRHIKTLLFISRRDTERREERDDLEDEPRREECVRGDRDDRNDLYPELIRIPEKKPVVPRRIDDLLREDTREDGAREAAHAVCRPDVERIVDTYLMRADIDCRVGDDARDDTDGDTGNGADET